MAEIDDILGYWLDELGPDGWYAGGEALDATIRARFEPVWQRAHSGLLNCWQISPRGALAFLIVTDQFPRNIFRGQAASFATDPLAHAAAHRAIGLGWDLRIPAPQRQFFYLPMMHAESGADQNRSVALFASRYGCLDPENLLHARAHRQVIRDFGRFPTRNEALGRESTASEVAYLSGGGYGAVVRALQA